VIEPHNTQPDKAFGRIHVGLYIAALLDAMDRMDQDIEHEKLQQESAGLDNVNRDGDGGGDQDGDGDGDGDGDEDEDPNQKRRRNNKTGKTKKKGKDSITTSLGGSAGQGKSHAEGMTTKDQVCFQLYFSLYSRT
jgi:hypothetical protein